jgi:ankyrin repeat protein
MAAGYLKYQSRKYNGDLPTAGPKKLIIKPRSDKYSTVEWLLESNKPWCANRIKNHSPESSPIHSVALSGNSEILKKFLNIAPPSWRVSDTIKGGTTPLHAAARNGDIKCIRLLLARGANVLSKDENGENVFHALRGDISAFEALIATIPQDIRKSALTQQNSDNETPIMLYARNQLFNLITMALKYGNTLTERGVIGWTLFHYVAAAGDLETLKKLLAIKPADFNIYDQNQTVSGQSVLYTALRYGKINCASYLVTEGISSVFEPIRADNGDDVSIFIALQKNWKGQLDALEALQWLAKECKQRKAKWISEEQSNVSPLHEAVYHTENGEPLGVEKLIEALLECGFDVNYMENKETPLDVARRNGFSKVEKVLSSNGGKSAKSLSRFKLFK